jgi:hypothetical protein
LASRYPATQISPHNQANVDNQPERDWFPKQGRAGKRRDRKSGRDENIGA